MICTTTYLSCPPIKMLSPNDFARRRYLRDTPFTSTFIEKCWEGRTHGDRSPHRSYAESNCLTLMQNCLRDPSIAFCSVSFLALDGQQQAEACHTPPHRRQTQLGCDSRTPAHTGVAIWGRDERWWRRAQQGKKSCCIVLYPHERLMSFEHVCTSETGTDAPNVSFLTSKGLLW